MWCHKQYIKNFKKGNIGNFIFFRKIKSGWFLTEMEVNNCIWSTHLLVKKKRIYFWCEFFIFRRSVFFFSVEAIRYFILHQKNILRYCMHLHDKDNKLYSLEYLLKHSSFRDILILLFACAYISYVEESLK